MLDLDLVFAKARDIKVAVLGDLMLDEWIIGPTERLSPEAPVPVVRLDRRVIAPGGAANVVTNILSLGGAATAGGIVGADDTGRDLAGELEKAGAEVGALVYDSSRPTTLKTRIVAQRQQVVRVDRESDARLSGVILAELRDSLAPLLKGCSALCVSDYDKGLAASGMVESAIQAGISAGIRVTGGPKPRNLERFRGADFISLNQKEASEAAGFKLDTVEAVEAAGQALRARSETNALAITRGSAGVSLFRQGQDPVHVPAHLVEVFDVAGAGDTFLSAATLALACGADFVAATEFGNIAAAASVRHAGVVAVTPEDVRQMAE